MVSDLEDLPESYGRNRTLLWLIPYEALDQQMAEFMGFFGYNTTAYIPTYENLDFFLEHAGYPPTIKTRKNAKYKPRKKNKICHICNFRGQTEVTAFQFTIISREMAEWSNRAIFEEKCRTIISKSAILTCKRKYQRAFLGTLSSTPLFMTATRLFWVCC